MVLVRYNSVFVPLCSPNTADVHRRIRNVRLCVLLMILFGMMVYGINWRDGLWYKLWDMGVMGRMWCVIKKMYMSSRSAVLLEGEKSDSFNVEQGVAQGCSLSPILFSVFINDLLKEVKQAELGIQLSSGKTFGGMLFADDFVGVSDSKESLQKLIIESVDSISRMLH